MVIHFSNFVFDHTVCLCLYHLGIFMESWSLWSSNWSNRWLNKWRPYYSYSIFFRHKGNSSPAIKPWDAVLG